ncbi:type II toxin-antitoxin system RelB/DinJ family antitoxin [Candidatus Falkowbacteria bacterium]|nr:type II toxin-antitoxin system RelB/DinJ family antitoxin [Candidatus Falkowbacteria bacterium]
MTTIQIRIHENDKKQVKKILDAIGLDMSSAIKLYFKQIQKYKGIPYLLTENNLTLEQEQEILSSWREAKHSKNLSSAMNANQLKKYLKGL